MRTSSWAAAPAATSGADRAAGAVGASAPGTSTVTGAVVSPSDSSSPDPAGGGTSSAWLAASSSHAPSDVDSHPPPGAGIARVTSSSTAHRLPIG